MSRENSVERFSDDSRRLCTNCKREFEFFCATCRKGQGECQCLELGQDPEESLICADCLRDIY